MYMTAQVGYSGSMARIEEEPGYDRLGEEGYRKLAAEFGVLHRKPAASLPPDWKSRAREERRLQLSIWTDPCLGVGVKRSITFKRADLMN